MKKLFIASLILISFGAMANSACDQPRNDFDGLYCLNKVYQEADIELNKNYKTLRPLLDANGQQALKLGQLAWIRKRNDECSRKEDDSFFVNLRCATDTTVERLRFLQDRIRECKSAGCMNSKL